MKEKKMQENQRHVSMYEIESVYANVLKVKLKIVLISNLKPVKWRFSHFMNNWGEHQTNVVWNFKNTKITTYLVAMTKTVYIGICY